MLNWFAKIIPTLVAISFIVHPCCSPAETYMWTDTNGHPVVSSERPPAHIQDFEVIGNDTSGDKSVSISPRQAAGDNAALPYGDFPPLVLEKIQRTAADRWPGKEEAQVAMVAQQVKAYRYMMDARYLDFPIDIRDRILRDVEFGWPDDYERQAAYIEQQYKSYRAILSYENLRLTDEMLEKIKEDAAEKWPYNYVKQERFVRREADYSIEKIGAQEPEDEVTGLRTYKLSELGNGNKE